MYSLMDILKITVVSIMVIENLDSLEIIIKQLTKVKQPLMDNFRLFIKILKDFLIID